MIVFLTLAGGLGAVCRFVVDGLIRTQLGRTLPWGTIAINVSGSFLLGTLTGLALHGHMSGDLKLILGTGFCGGYTTFSTASFEAVRLIEERRFLAAMAHIGATFGLSLVAALGGLCLGTQ